MTRRYLRALCATLLLATAMLAACGDDKPPSRWDNAQNASTQPKKDDAPPAPPAEAGGSFNKFFPKGSGEFTTVPAQEKSGFAEHKLKKDGKDVAMLAINDMNANPKALDKFKQSTRKIGGFPAADTGATKSSVLVADRYQVSVISSNPSFTKADREAWLQKFDLAGLSNLK